MYILLSIILHKINTYFSFDECDVQGSIEDVFRFATFCVQFASYVGLFVLTVFPEPRSARATYTLLPDDIDEVCSPNHP